MTDTTIIVTQSDAPTVITTTGEQGPPGPAGSSYASAAAQAATEAARDDAAASAASALDAYNNIVALGDFNFDCGNAATNYGGATPFNAGGAT